MLDNFLLKVNAGDHVYVPPKDNVEIVAASNENLMILIFFLN